MHGKDRLLQLIDNERLLSTLTDLYGRTGNFEFQRARYASLIGQHPIPGTEETGLFSAPGRTELGGNHTDHNGGKVLAGAINLDTIAVATPVAEPVITIHSEGFPTVMVDLNDLSFHPEERGSTDALARGIVRSLVDRGRKIGGFIANTSSLVRPGSGLSSSAAIEILIATICNEFFNNGSLGPIELAECSRFAENHYYGKPSGLMDQLACAAGGITAMDFSSPDRVQLQQICWDPTAQEFDLVIVHTGSGHERLGHEYGTIFTEMRTVADCFDQEVLASVPFGLFIDTIPTLRNRLCDDRAVLRAFHFFTENSRVDAMIEACKSADMSRYLALVQESGNSSALYLQNLYSNQAPAAQNIPLALALSSLFLEGSGACRVHGGGFAGTIQVYVPRARTIAYRNFMEPYFGENSITEISVRQLPAMRVDTNLSS